MSSRAIADLAPELQLLALAFLRKLQAQGFRVFITQTWRSSEEQDADYAKGRTEPGSIITCARGGQSKHNCMQGGAPASRAFDFAIENDDGSLNWNVESVAWQVALETGKALGLVSGGDFSDIKDWPHFELPS